MALVQGQVKPLVYVCEHAFDTASSSLRAPRDTPQIDTSPENALLGWAFLSSPSRSVPFTLPHFSPTPSLRGSWPSRSPPPLPPQISLSDPLSHSWKVPMGSTSAFSCLPQACSLMPLLIHSTGICSTCSVLGPRWDVRRNVPLRGLTEEAAPTRWVGERRGQQAAEWAGFDRPQGGLWLVF